MTALQETELRLSQSEHAPEIPCTVDIGLLEVEIEQIDSSPRGRFEQMSASGSGFSCYGPEHKRYGRSELIQAIKFVCAEWAKAFPNGPRIGVGNISLAGGGPMHPHTSHQKGLDVDLAPIASTQEEIGLTWNDPKYSRERTQKLVDLIRSNPFLSIRTILFNDPKINGVIPWDGHDDHLHVSFLPPGVAGADHSSDQQGNLRLVIPNMKGARVRKLQEDLTAVGISVTVDGVFGRGTDAAVRKFQSSQGLEVDGVVGIITQAKLAELIRHSSARGSAPRGAGTTLQSVIDQNQVISFDDLNSGVLLDDQVFCREVQTILRAEGLLQTIDGLYGPKTREALRQFKASRQLGGGDVLGATTAKALLDARPGFGKLPDWQGGDRKAAIQAIIQEARRQGITDRAQIAYILATVQHETNDSFQPVREAYFLGEPKGENYRKTLRYYPFYGRGYVQLTWDYNYRQYSGLTGLDLVNEPDLVMRPDVSLFVLVDGMKRGVFTGKRLSQFIAGSTVDFHSARRIINGMDKAALVANYATTWQTNLA